MSTNSSNPLEKVSNFMTDRSATENKAKNILLKEIQSSCGGIPMKCQVFTVFYCFTNMLFRNKAHFITKICSSYILLKEIQSSSSHSIESFKCAVHPLLQFSDICEKELIKLEN
jgi:hypothetical protein